MFRHFEMYLEQEKVVRIDFAEYLILISNIVSIYVVVFVLFFIFEIKINVSGHLVHIVVLSKLAS